MAYLDHDDSLYSASTTPKEFNSHPFLGCQTLATTEEACRHVTPTFAGRWATVGRPESSTAPPTSLLATSYGGQFPGPSTDLHLTHESLGSVSPAFGSHPAPLHGSHWPMITRYTQPDHPGTLSRDNLFVGGQGRETAIQALSLNPSKYHSGFWELEIRILTNRNQSRPSPGASSSTACQPTRPTW